jgi:uncharacterized protein (UPF0332 family)
LPSPLETLIYVARLSADEKDAALTIDRSFPQTGLWARLLSAVEEVAIDRLVRADGCLQVAKLLHTASLGVAGSEELRGAASRAYYSIHHSIRAMCLWQNKWDPDGHEESIRELKKLLTENTFLHRTGLARGVLAEVNEARENRHVADYSPYDFQRNNPGDGFEEITGERWDEAAKLNIDLAERMLAAGFRFVGL